MISAIAIDDEPLALQVIETFCKEVDFISLNKTFTKPNEALKYLRKFPTDLLFVDIKMPSISGLSLVKTIQQNTMVIFTTAYTEFAVESYELNAIDYLLKPINRDRFKLAVNKARDYFAYLSNKDHSNEKFIFIRADFSLIKVPLSDILLIEGLADYLQVFIKNRKTIVARMTMKEMVQKLPARDFIRVNRSFIVPESRILYVRNKTIFLSDREIPIGNTYIKSFLERFAQ
jgi:two-component system, LytTR family, response regulator